LNVKLVLVRTPRLLAAGAVLLACLGVSCSVRPRAGTGDVAFRLLWDGISDLDLFVVDPAGGCIDFLARRSDSGGILDIDCNSQTNCPHPIENVYWPSDTAPAGTYTYWVYTNSLIAAETPLAFELQLLRGPEVVWRQRGSVQKLADTFGPFVYDFSRERQVAPRASGGPLPACGAWVERQQKQLQDFGTPAPPPPPPSSRKP
jgi:hypothetical protein